MSRPLSDYKEISLPVLDEYYEHLYNEKVKLIKKMYPRVDDYKFFIELGNAACVVLTDPSDQDAYRRGQYLYAPTDVLKEILNNPLIPNLHGIGMHLETDVGIYRSELSVTEKFYLAASCRGPEAMRYYHAKGADIKHPSVWDCHRLLGSWSPRVMHVLKDMEFNFDIPQMPALYVINGNCYAVMFLKQSEIDAFEALYPNKLAVFQNNGAATMSNGNYAVENGSGKSPVDGCFYDKALYEYCNKLYGDTYKPAIYNTGAVPIYATVATAGKIWNGESFIPLTEDMIIEHMKQWFSPRWLGYMVNWAAENNYVRLLKDLISRGAEVHVQNNSAYISATLCGNLEIMKTLDDADTNKQPAVLVEHLVHAAYNGNVECVDYLIGKYNYSQEELTYALTMSVSLSYFRLHDICNGRMSPPDTMVKYLVEHGADVHKASPRLFEYYKDNADMLMVLRMCDKEKS